MEIGWNFDGNWMEFWARFTVKRFVLEWEDTRSSGEAVAKVGCSGVWWEGKYDRLCPDTAGVIRSQGFPGLWLAVDALLQDERSRLLAVVQAGLQTAEHQAFVQKLRNGDRVI